MPDASITEAVDAPSREDNLARPEHANASRHRRPPPQRYALKQVGMHWYMVPLIYEWGFEMYVKACREDDAHPRVNPDPKDMPKYAVLVDLSKLTFENPRTKND